MGKNHSKEFNVKTFKYEIVERHNIPQKYKILSEVIMSNQDIKWVKGKLETGKEISIKKFKKTETGEHLFKNEVNLLKTLDHPNLASIYDFFQTERSYFIIFPYFKS